MSTTLHFFVADGPAPSKVFETDHHYFAESLAADRGGVLVIHSDGSADAYSGNRYMQPEARVAAERAADGALKVTSGDIVLREYAADEWYHSADLSDHT